MKAREEEDLLIGAYQANHVWLVTWRALIVSHAAGAEFKVYISDYLGPTRPSSTERARRYPVRSGYVRRQLSASLIQSVGHVNGGSERQKAHQMAKCDAVCAQMPRIEHNELQTERDDAGGRPGTGGDARIATNPNAIEHDFTRKPKT